RNSIFLTAWRRSSNAAAPPSSKARPYLVGSTPRGGRSTRRTPTMCSNSAIDLEMADCPVFRSAAALFMLPACTTAIRTWRCCSFIGWPIRSLTCIASLPITTLRYVHAVIALCAHNRVHYIRGPPLASPEPEETAVKFLRRQFLHLAVGA